MLGTLLDGARHDTRRLIATRGAGQDATPTISRHWRFVRRRRRAAWTSGQRQCLRANEAWYAGLAEQRRLGRSQAGGERPSGAVDIARSTGLFTMHRGVGSKA